MTTKYWKVYMSKSQNKPYYYNTITNVIQWEKPDELNDTLSPNWEVHMSRSQNKPYYYNTITNVIQWEKPTESSCSIIKGLTWIGNSCYIDSTLIALLSTSSEFIDQILYTDITNEYVKNLICYDNTEDEIKFRKLIQKHLRKIYNFIHGINNNYDSLNCINLRKILSRCQLTYQYSTTELGDSSDFLNHLLQLLPTPHAIVRNTIYTKYTDDTTKITKNIDKNASVVWTILPTLLDKETIYIESLLKTSIDDIKPIGDIKIVIERNKLIQSPFIIFDIMRGNKSNNIIPSEILRLNESIYYLVSIVIFKNAHYICVFQCNDTWYVYNDIDTDMIQQIGTFKDMLNFKPSPIKNGTQYYYKLVE